MVDIGTGLALVGSAKLAEKILGPTAEYLGNGLKSWAEIRLKNLGQIFSQAEEILGEKINDPGKVPAKVLKGILDDASFCEDEIAQKYFAGVLAASRTPKGTDDRGAAIINLLTRLSSYQLRTHYILYSGVYSLFRNSHYAMKPDERDVMGTFISLSNYLEALDIPIEEMTPSLMDHIFFGLHHESLIGDDFVYGQKSFLEKTYDPIEAQHGVCFFPTILGAQLYLWGNGAGEKALSDLFSGNVSISPSFSETILNGFKKTALKNSSRTINSMLERLKKGVKKGSANES